MTHKRIFLKLPLREMDIIARLGGDGFAVLMQEVGLEYSDVARNRLREQLTIHNARENREFKLSLFLILFSLGKV